MAYSTLRLVAYDVQSRSRLGVLTTSSDINFDAPHCTGGLPTLSFTVTADPTDAKILATLPEIAVEIYDGAAWREARGGRFHTVGADTDSLDPRGAASVSCIHVARLLDGGRVGTGIGMTTDGAWRTATVGPGILREFMERERGRGWWPALAFDFTSTVDSAGTPWAYKRMREYAPTDSFQELLEAVVSGGEAEWTCEANTLRMFTPEGGLAVDRSATVKLRLARAIEAPEKRSLDGVMTAVLVKGEDGKLFEVVNPSATPRWGKITGAVDVSGVTSQAQAQSQAMPMLVAGEDVREQYTRKFDLTRPGTPRPFIDYQVGDWISVERIVGGQTRTDKSRVMKVSMQGEQGHVTLGTLLDSLEAKLVARAKQTTPVVGGDSSGRGGAEEPRDRYGDAPVVTAFSEVYVTAGWPVGRVRLEWPVVSRSVVKTTGTQGDFWVQEPGTVEVDRYIVSGIPRVNARGLDTSRVIQLGQTENPYFVHEGLTPGERWDYLVVSGVKGTPFPGPGVIGRAEGTVNAAGNVSAWITVDVVKDIIPPPAPSVPMLTSTAGTVKIVWDGRASTGGVMPADFERIDIEARAQNTGNTWTLVGPITVPGGFYVHGPLDPGTVWEYRLRAIDRSANTSPYSAVAEITVASLKDDPTYIDLEKKIVDAREDAVTRALAADTAMRSQIDAEVDAAQAVADAAKADAAAAQSDADAAQAVADSAVAAAAAAAAKASSKPDQWGSLTTAPSKARDGGALVIGSTYQDATKGNAVMMWDGSKWLLVTMSDGAIVNLTSASIKTFGLSADRVQIGVAENLIVNADFERGIEPHQVRTGTLVTATTPIYKGTFSAKWTVPAVDGSNPLHFYPGGVANKAASDRYPAAVGDEFYARIRFYADATNAARAGSVRLQYFVYNAAGSYLGAYMIAQATATAGQWVELSGSAKVALANATYGALVVSLAARPAVDTDLYFDDAYLAAKTAGQLIVNGAITTNLIAADAVTAVNIAATAIQTKHLAAGAVTALNIAADAIQAIHIAADAVIARHIKAFSITVDKLLIGVAQNLVPNAGFEAGVEPHAATRGTLSLVTADKRTGAQCLGVRADAGVTETLVLFGGAAQQVEAKASDELRVSAWYRLATGNASTVKLQVFQYRADGTYISSIIPPESADSPPSTTWKSITGSVKITDTAVAKIVIGMSILSASADTPLVYVDDVRAAFKGTGELIVDGSIIGDNIAANTIDVTKLNVASLAADVGFVGKFFANSVTAGYVRAQAIYAEMFQGKTFTGGTFTGQIINGVEINGANLNLTSTSYTSGRLQVRAAGSTRAMQLDANGLHVLPDFNSGVKWVSLGMDRKLTFYGAGQGEAAWEGLRGDIRITTDFLGDNSNISALWFDSKHGSLQSQRLRAPAIALQPGSVELRFDGLEMAGSAAGGVGISLGYRGDQDAIALGNIYQAKGYMYRSNTIFAGIMPGDLSWARCSLEPQRAVLGVATGQHVGMVDCWTGGVSLYRSGDARNGSSNLHLADQITITPVSQVRVEKALSVGGNISASGSVSGATKNFVIVHPDPDKPGWLLRYSVTESPHVGVEDWSADEPVTIGADGSVLVTLRDHWPHLTHPFTTVVLTVHGRTPAAVSYLPEGAGFRIYGPPGTRVVWVAKAVRRDVPRNIVEELDLDRAMDIAEVTPPSDAALDGLLNAIDKATGPREPITTPALAGAVPAVRPEST